MLGTLFLLPLIFYFLPINNFENYDSICLVKNIFGFECWGCGITHSLYLVIHLKFSHAWEMNKLAFIVFPILVYLWLKYLILIIRKLKAN